MIASQFSFSRLRICGNGPDTGAAGGSAL
jgi:hypothetical protein